jgi:tetratricopeptide (TPR) repeat protein
MAAVLLALLCAAIYAGSGASEWVGADYPEIVENAGMRWREISLAHVRDAFARPHPVVQLSYGLNYRLGRLDVHRYHAVNIALHVANALLVFGLGRALFRRAGASARIGLSDEAAPWAALAGAALFAAHPLQVEAVTWIAQRGSLLAALGSLGATLCYLRARDSEPPARAVWWAATGVCWLFALGSREVAVVLPVAIGLCEWLVGGDPTRAFPRRLSIAIGLCVAAAVLWMTVRNASALALYESLVVFPAPARLSLVHDLGGSPLALGAAVAWQVLLLGTAAAGARRYRVFCFALLWFFCVHAGEAAFAAPPLAAEHRNYFALIGPALGAAFALFAALRHRLGLATALAVLAVAAFGAVTHERTEQWRSAEALWDDAIDKSPGDATARLERGALREALGRASEALADFDEAVRLAPASARARARLAASLAGLRREGEALPHAREAVALDPESAAAHAALGRTLALLGELEPAAAAFARALELGSEPGLERSLGDTLVRLGRFEESLPHYHAAIARDPGDDDARTGAGAALVELARAREALGYLEPAVESQPNPRYLAHFADALWQLGDAGGALDAVAMAVRVGPSWPGATSRLTWMLALCPDAERRDPARALRIADVALAHAGSPDPALLDARAAALAAAGRFADARADAERAADLAREAGDAALAASIAAHAESYARRVPWPDPPRPFEASR